MPGFYTSSCYILPRSLELLTVVLILFYSVTLYRCCIFLRAQRCSDLYVDPTQQHMWRRRPLDVQEFRENTAHLYKYYVSGRYPSCFYLKHRSVYISKHNVSQTGFCLRLTVKPTQSRPIDRSVSETLYFRQKMGRWIMSRNNICTNVRSSQTFRSCLQLIRYNRVVRYSFDGETS
jgi:hypothetical protein